MRGPRLTSVFIMIFAGLFSSCAQKEIPANLRREPPKAEARVVTSQLKGGFPSLKGRKIGALVVFNLPDGYLIRAKSKINPPDFALKEVLELQRERSSWLDEALVTNCDGCDVETVPPLEILPEELLLRLIDMASLRQKPTEADWRAIEAAWPDRDVIWLVLGSDDYEKKRGPSREKGLLTAWSQNTVLINSFVRGRPEKKVLHQATVKGHDEDVIFYEMLSDRELTPQTKARVASFSTDDAAKWEPPGSIYDGSRFDDVYPYPPVPESPLIIQKSLLRLTETLAP